MTLKRPMRVYVAAFGSGMGHASRMEALARELAASGDRVGFSSSGEVTRWLASRGYSCNDIPLVDVVFTPAGNFSARATLRLSPVILERLCEQVQREVANIGGFRPDVVLSDSVAATVLASRIQGVRSVAVVNQLRLISSPTTPRPIAKALTAASVAFGGVIWDYCDDVLVPDLPPPYTISERNLWMAGRTSGRARYVGFLTPRWAPAPAPDRVMEKWTAEKRRRKVYWQVSGPPATRRPFLAKALAAAKELGDEYMFVVAAGDPAAETSAREVPGAYVYGWCPDARAFIDTCDVVVSRAGHVSISEYIQHAKPSLLVPIQAQTEQIGNAAKARKLGISVTEDEGRLGPSEVKEGLRALESESYFDRARELRTVAARYDALSSIREVLAKA